MLPKPLSPSLKCWSADTHKRFWISSGCASQAGEAYSPAGRSGPAWCMLAATCLACKAPTADCCSLLVAAPVTNSCQAPISHANLLIQDGRELPQTSASPGNNLFFVRLANSLTQKTEWRRPSFSYTIGIKEMHRFQDAKSKFKRILLLQFCLLLLLKLRDSEAYLLYTVAGLSVNKNPFLIPLLNLPGVAFNVLLQVLS